MSCYTTAVKIKDRFVLQHNSRHKSVNACPFFLEAVAIPLLVSFSGVSAHVAEGKEVQGGCTHGGKGGGRYANSFRIHVRPLTDSQGGGRAGNGLLYKQTPLPYYCPPQLPIEKLATV